MSYIDKLKVGNTLYDIRSEVDTTLSVSGVPADAKAVGDEVEDLKDAIFDTTFPSVKVNEIDGITTQLGMSASAGMSAILIQSNANFDSYYFITSKAIDLWVGTVSATYFAIVIGGTYQSTSTSASETLIYCDGTKTRYRNIDNNLPTVNNKLHIPANCPIVFTVTKNTMESVYGVETNSVVSDEFKSEIVKPKYLQYISGSGADSSTERLCIYIPNGVGFVRYDFVHTVSATRNADVWRIGYATYVDNEFNEVQALTTAGEWECAIKIEGRADFSGGYIHGDEVLTDIVFIVDGTPINISTLTNITPFNSLSVFETSNLYDPNDSTTIFAYHGSEHKFSNEGVVIRQSVKFISAVTIVSAYLAMFPIAKAVSNKVIPNNSYAPLDASSISVTDTDIVTIYKTDGNVMAVFAVPKYEAFNGGKFAFWCLDNGTTEYNKCYYVCASSAVNIEANRLVKTETRYDFSVGE